MDIYKYVNSKDIRTYLRKIGYEFDSLEAAWLIYQCKHITITEKHEAWKELIETMPDCKMGERRGEIPQENLHTFLKNYMRIEDELLDKFYDEKHAHTFSSYKPYVYKFEYIYKNGTEDDWHTVFSCFDTIHESIMKPDEDVECIRCTKMQVDEIDTCDVVYLTPEFEAINLFPGKIEDNDSMYWSAFEWMWFDFPTPFKKGDILWDPNRPDGLCAGPFVTTGVCLDGIKDEKLKERIRKYGDTTDMFAGGYFLCDDGSTYQEGTGNYMDLEFYNKDLVGSQRTLIAISNYLKGEIDLMLFARAYHQIITNGYAEESVPRDYYPSNLILAGISNKQIREG